MSITLVGGLVLLIIAAAFAVRSLVRSRNTSGDFHPVHAGKGHVGGCKFDAEEVRRTRFSLKPAIDTSNLPAPDPLVVQAFAGVTEKVLRDTVDALSGEVAVVVNGSTVTIKSRNSFHSSLDLAMSHLEEYYRALGLNPVRETYRARGKTHNNLVVEIKGKTEPAKFVLVGSHLDSTAGRTGSAEPVAPGADDDGSGTTGSMVLAAALNDFPLDYTVRIVHFTGEEQGLWGSYAHSDKVAAAKENLLYMIEMDMIGWCSKPGNRVDIHDDQDTNGSHEIVAAMVRNVKRYGLDLNAVDTHNFAVHNRSDHAGFLDHGYKAVLVSEEFTDDGFNPNYHSTGDRAKTLNYPFMANVVKMVLATVADFARKQS